MMTLDECLERDDDARITSSWSTDDVGAEVEGWLGEAWQLAG